MWNFWVFFFVSFCTLYHVHVLTINLLLQIFLELLLLQWSLPLSHSDTTHACWRALCDGWRWRPAQCMELELYYSFQPAKMIIQSCARTRVCSQQKKKKTIPLRTLSARLPKQWKSHKINSSLCVSFTGCMFTVLFISRVCKSLNFPSLFMRSHPHSLSGYEACIVVTRWRQKVKKLIKMWEWWKSFCENISAQRKSHCRRLVVVCFTTSE